MPIASGSSLFGQASAGFPPSSFPATKYPVTGGQATMSGEPYAPATGPGAGSAAIAMAQPGLQVETAAGRVPDARPAGDSFIAPQPAEPEPETYAAGRVGKKVGRTGGPGGARDR